MKKVVLVSLCATVFVGCGTLGGKTPEPVLQLGVIQADTLNTLRQNEQLTVDDFEAEIKGLLLQRFQAEFSTKEQILLDMGGNTGMVDMQLYKDTAEAMAFEMAKAEAYYDAQIAGYRLRLAMGYERALRIQDALQRYNEEAGISPELFNQALQSTSSLLEEALTEYAQYQANREELDASKVDWKDVVKIYNRKLQDLAIARSDDPFAGLSDLLSGIDLGNIFGGIPRPEQPQGDLK